MNKQQGFVLIELIAVIVLVGIIASFSTFFLFTGFNGYINSKNATDGNDITSIGGDPQGSELLAYAGDSRVDPAQRPDHHQRPELAAALRILDNSTKKGYNPF